MVVFTGTVAVVAWHKGERRSRRKGESGTIIGDIITIVTTGFGRYINLKVSV